MPNSNSSSDFYLEYVNNQYHMLKVAVESAFQQTNLDALMALLSHQGYSIEAKEVLFDLCQKLDKSADEQSWIPLWKVLINAAKSDKYYPLLKIGLDAIGGNPFRYFYNQQTAHGIRKLNLIDFAGQNNALQNFKFLAEAACRMDDLNFIQLQENYGNNEHIRLLMNRLKDQQNGYEEFSNDNLLFFLNLTDDEDILYQDQNIFIEENMKRMQIKNEVKQNLTGASDARTVNAYMPKWEEAFLYADEYDVLYSASGQIFSVNEQGVFRYCSGTHIGEGYFLAAGHCNDSCLSQLCEALPSIRVTFDYQYNQQGEYVQSLDNQYQVTKLIYNGFIVEPAELGLSNGEKYDDYLIFKLDSIPPQAVACTTEMPAPGEQITMMHHPNGMLKKISFGNITAVEEDVYGEEQLKSDIKHNAHDWGGSSGAGIFWNARNVICAIHVASYDVHMTCSDEYPGSAVSIKRIADDIKASPMFNTDKDMQNVYRLLTSQGMFRHNVRVNNSENDLVLPPMQNKRCQLN